MSPNIGETRKVYVCRIMDSSRHQSAILPWTDAKAVFSTAEGSADWKFPRYDVTAQLSEKFFATRRDTERIRFHGRKEKGDEKSTERSTSVIYDGIIFGEKKKKKKESNLSNTTRLADAFYKTS